VPRHPRRLRTSFSLSASLYTCLCAVLPPSHAHKHLADLESMAWDFRFGKTGGADSLAESPLLPPLQRMIAHVQDQEPGAGWPVALCEDECGTIKRLRLWEHPRNDSD